MPSIYDYSTIGVTSGAQSLKMTTGTDTQYHVYQYLALDLNYDQRVAFKNNNRFSIDFSVGPGTAGGRMQIYEMVLNAEVLGWNTMTLSSSDPSGNLYFDMWDGSPVRTMTISFDYDPSSLTEVPGYVQIVISVQDGGSAEPNFYWDNARLTQTNIVLGSYSDAVAADDPALWLRFESDSAVDSSANNHTTGYQEGSELVEGDGIGNSRYLIDDHTNAVWASVLDEGISWGGTYGDEFAFVDDGDAVPDDDITFEFWYNTVPGDYADPNATVPGLQPYTVFFQQIETDYTKAPGIANSDGYFRVLSGDPNTTDPNATQFWWYTGVETPADGQWHHVVLSYDESLGGDQNVMGITLYLDGGLADSTTVGNATWPAKLGPELDHIVIGGRSNRGWTWDYPERYTGKIDEFAIYPGVLSPERVAIHYASGMCTMSQGDLTGDCKVDFDDFAVLASEWLLCNDPALFLTDPDCEATW